MLGGCCGLPDYARNTIVDRLRQSTTYGTDGYYQRFGIPTGLPDERTLAVKQGWMDVNGQRYNHTTGIVGDDNRFILVVLGYENRTNGDVNHTTETLNQVVGAMYPERIVPRVQGAIADDWYALGGATSPVGLPLGNENPIFDHSGVFTLFQRGSIYWSPASGAHEILGAIRDAWAALGYEQGRLGYPVTDELGTPNQDGAYNHFQGGSLYWSPPTGAHLVTGAIQDAWAAQGWERSALGYPTSDEAATASRTGAFNRFQHGAIYWSPGTGAHAMTAPILARWVSLGSETGALGYPTSDPYAVPGRQERGRARTGDPTRQRGAARVAAVPRRRRRPGPAHRDAHLRGRPRCGVHHRGPGQHRCRRRRPAGHRGGDRLGRPGHRGVPGQRCRRAHRCRIRLHRQAVHRRRPAGAGRP